MCNVSQSAFRVLSSIDLWDCKVSNGRETKKHDFQTTIFICWIFQAFRNLDIDFSIIKNKCSWTLINTLKLLYFFKILFHKISVDLILSFPGLTCLTSVEKEFLFIKPGDSKTLQQKGERSQVQGEKKRKRSPSSSSSFISSSSSNSSTESENKIVDERFKIIPKGEEFKWNLPSSIADYVNLHFKNYIPNKDINEKILTKNPVPSNLQEVPVLDDFVKTLLVSLISRWKSFRKKIYRLCVRYRDPGKDWKIFETSLLKLWKYL